MMLQTAPDFTEAAHALEPAYSPLLSVRDLVKHYPIRGGLLNRVQGVVKAVDGVNLDVYPGQTLGIVGESGCGKSTLARAIIRLEEPTAGTVMFDGEDWLSLHGAELRQKRANMQMIFQNPYASLNPRLSVGQAVAEPLEIFKRATGQAKHAEVAKLLDMVGLTASMASRMPSELSGGQRQRVCIARALALRPKLIIADEAVSALDVSVQAQVLNLMDELKRELGLTYLFIAHNLSVVEHFCDDIAVMYLGKIVERASTKTLFAEPKHPYTQALLAAAPIADPVRAAEMKRKRLKLSGELPSPMNPPSGCAFHTRCPQVMESCSTLTPALLNTGTDSQLHQVACHLHPTLHLSE
jgi:oligopeptide transport system ATP-binding protein